MGDSQKYFATTKKGELAELKEELNNKDQSRRKDAVKKVIALMTVGKDVSMLFADVVNCIQTPNMELKKLVYLYLMNYAKSNPDLAIMAVNSFVKDSRDNNPLIRALAVRTMGCIRVEKITEYLAAPLKRTLKDPHPYVRKTAAICVAKLYDIKPDLVVEQGFLEILQELLADSTPMVVANAVVALAEIQEQTEDDVFVVTPDVLMKLMSALNECTEWGQVFILDALSRHMADNEPEIESILERVVPRLQHANAAVVLSTIKVILRIMESMAGDPDDDRVRSMCKKMTQPLVTLLSAEPEVQYVALRNIELIIQRWPLILQNEIKVFFCKYNDPIYVKMEKLEIMIRLSNERNYEHVLMEFKEYASGVDVDFVRKAVHAIGRIAIKIDEAAAASVRVLLELIQTRVNYVVQEAVSVIKNIFRKYPNQYESIIATLCENLDTLDEAEAKASMIWIIGEYSDRIDNADELLESFLDSFNDESPGVQLQLLTAVVKLYLRRPEASQEMIEKVLSLSTQTSDNPDLRDRGYVYWRLCSAQPEAARAVVFSEKPLISETSHNLSSSLLAELLDNIATLSSVYHKPPDRFVGALKGQANISKRRERIWHMTADEAADEETMAEADHEEREVTGVGDLLDLGTLDSAPQAEPASIDAISDADLLGSVFGAAATTTAAPPVTAAIGTVTAVPAGSIIPADGGMVDLMSLSPKVATSSAPQQLKVVLSAAKGKGLQVSCGWRQQDGGLLMDLQFENLSGAVLTQLAIQMNKNFFGLKNASPLQLPILQAGATERVSLPMNFEGVVADSQSAAIQVAVRALPVGVAYFQDFLPLRALFVPEGRMEKPNFLSTWKAIPDANEQTQQFTNLPVRTVEALIGKLTPRGFFFVAQRKSQDGVDFVYLSAKTMTNVEFLVEVSQQSGTDTANVACRTVSPQYVPVLFADLKKVFYE